MQNAFLSVIITSVAGTVLAIILTALRPFTRKLFSAHWHYLMWIAVLIIMVLPIRIPLPENTVDIPDAVVAYTDDAVFETKQFQDITPLSERKTSYLPSIWLAVAFLALSLKLVNYFLFLSKLNRTSTPTVCPQISSFTKKCVRVRKSNVITSPLMVGVFTPTLLLPDTEMTAEQLHNVLSHEMTHFKRGDVLVKWFVSIVKCIHWFNPAVYFISRQMTIDCEISCDLKATENMSNEEKLSYVNTILSLLSTGRVSNALTTGMTSTKNTLKRRFKMIKNHTKSTKTKIIISTVFAVVIVATTLFASGVLAGNVINEDEASQTFVWPCPDSNNVSRIFDKENHPAIDIPAQGGSDVLAVYGGKVTAADYDKQRGYYIITDNGTATVLYAHLSAIDVNEGDSVSSGDVIGKVGKTGMATGDHLHLELTEYGEATNPLEYALDVNITQPQKRPF